MNDEKNKAIHALVRPDPPGKDGWGLVVERAKAWVVTKRYYPRMDNSQQHEMLADFAIQIRDEALATREREIDKALEKVDELLESIYDETASPRVVDLANEAEAAIASVRRHLGKE